MPTKTAIDYDAIDECIIDAISAGKNPLYDRFTSAEARRIAAETDREDFRIVDARLQALRKAGRIVHQKKAKDGASGWRVV